LTRRGYCFLAASEEGREAGVTSPFLHSGKKSTAQPDMLKAVLIFIAYREAFEKFAVAASSFGAGDVRHHKTTVAEYQRSGSVE